MTVIAPTLDAAIEPIGDGCMLAVPREVSGVAMAATRALIRRGVKRLHLVALPTSTLQADMLIGAGCVATLETSAVSLGELGPRAAIHRRDQVRRDHHEGRNLSGALCRDGSGRERHPVHAAARHHRVRPAAASQRMAHHRQSVRQQRSDRRAAGDQARCHTVPRAAGGQGRQRVDRHAARSHHAGACLRKNDRDGRGDFRRRFAGGSRFVPLAHCPAFTSTPLPLHRRAPGRYRCRATTPPMWRI